MVYHMRKGEEKSQGGIWKGDLQVVTEETLPLEGMASKPTTITKPRID